MNFYIGKMKQTELDYSATNSQILFGSYAMAAEGLDIPDLNVLIMATPRKEIEQSIGRIIRKYDPACIPVIWDIIDMLPSFIAQSYSRKRIYKKNNFIINTVNLQNLNEDLDTYVSNLNISNNENNLLDIDEIDNEINNDFFDFID